MMVSHGEEATFDSFHGEEARFDNFLQQQTSVQQCVTWPIR